MTAIRCRSKWSFPEGEQPLRASRFAVAPARYGWNQAKHAIVVVWTVAYGGASFVPESKLDSATRNEESLQCLEIMADLLPLPSTRQACTPFASSSSLPPSPSHPGSLPDSVITGFRNLSEPVRPVVLESSTELFSPFPRPRFPGTRPPFDVSNLRISQIVAQREDGKIWFAKLLSPFTLEEQELGARVRYVYPDADLKFQPPWIGRDGSKNVFKWQQIRPPNRRATTTQPSISWIPYEGTVPSTDIVFVVDGEDFADQINQQVSTYGELPSLV